MTPQFNQRLEEILKKQEAHFADCPWENREFYAFWLSQSSYFVNHSTRLLGLAISQAPNGIHPYLKRNAEHILEEFGHEAMAERDVKALGYKLEDFPELFPTKIFYRNQYHGIQKFGAHYLIGYTIFLESISARLGPGLAKRLMKAFPSAHLFIKVHAEDDQEHIVNITNQLRTLDAKQMEEVIESMTMASEGYLQILEQIKDQLGSKQRRSA